MAQKRITLKITGLTDDHAAEDVLSTISSVPGVEFAEMSAQDGTTHIDYDDEQASVSDFTAAVIAAGYGVESAS